MKQILQNLSNGETIVADIPCPQSINGQLLIITKKTLVSAGTERMLVEFGKSNFLKKALSQPDKVKMVLEKIKTDGLIPTVDAVRSKLDQPLPLGYCNVGVVQSNGNTNFKIGTRVVSNGYHAEVVRVAKNLCAEIPENVDDESAAFTVLAAVAMQGIRIVNPTIGESIVVTGLGLIGLIAVQILKANGCRVLGMDFDSSKCALARKFGAETVLLSNGEDPIARADSFSRCRGVDAVIICASTSSNDPVSQAAKMCRKRGRIVLVGVVGLELSRADFYEKEISFQVSCSYGPGRYDPDYEEGGKDYPVGFIRWTEQRNFEAVLDLMSVGALDMKPLISHRFEINDAVSAYACLDDRSSLGIILNYSPNLEDVIAQKKIEIRPCEEYIEDDVVCGFVGGGSYASRVLIPAFKSSGAKLDTLLTSGGVSAVHHGLKNNFSSASTDYAQLLQNNKINTVVIATQHDLHAKQVVDGLKAGKNIFVEKPLAISLSELEKIESVYFSDECSSRIMVGFNRRFSPLVIKMKSLLAKTIAPKSFIFTMNAGAIPSNHWTQNLEVGGGRIIGEACHYIDLMLFLTDSEITGCTATCMGPAPGVDIVNDKATITLSFRDGSFGTIHYFANGGKVFPKERIEVFCEGAALQIDNFRRLKGFGWKGFKTHSLLSQDKGQKHCVEAFVSAIRKGEPSPISFEQLMSVSRVTIQASEAMRNN